MHLQLTTAPFQVVLFIVFHPLNSDVRERESVCVCARVLSIDGNWKYITIDIATNSWWEWAVSDQLVS